MPLAISDNLNLSIPFQFSPLFVCFLLDTRTAILWLADCLILMVLFNSPPSLFVFCSPQGLLSLARFLWLADCLILMVLFNSPPSLFVFCSPQGLLSLARFLWLADCFILMGRSTVQCFSSSYLSFLVVSAARGSTSNTKKNVIDDQFINNKQIT
jgi:hypothetical protein